MCKNLFKISATLLIVLVSIQIEILIAGRSKQSLLDIPKFKKFSCEFSEEMLTWMNQNSSCNLTKIDKRLSAINLYVSFKNLTDHLYVSS